MRADPVWENTIGKQSLETCHGHRNDLAVLGYVGAGRRKENLNSGAKELTKLFGLERVQTVELLKRGHGPTKE